MKDLKLELKSIIEHGFIQAILSSPKTSDIAKKIDVRALDIKGKKSFQLSLHKKDKVFHENYEIKFLLEKIYEYILLYKQTIISTEQADFHILINKNDKPTILKKSKAKQLPLMTQHNRQKNYLLEPNAPFLMELGVSSKEGKVYPQKQDKFKQINKFLEFIQDTLSHLPKTEVLHIVDFGCGKAYLTFALYHYLKNVLKYEIKVTGLDLKEDVIAFCEKTAKKLLFKNLHFQQGNIHSFATKDPVHMMVCLHACDTATDAALEKAILWKTDVIMAVPCCQQELYPQVKAESLKPLLSHGILKERFASLATDAARVQLLEIAGYKAQIMEFIDLEHTPKNLLIRAYKRSEPISNESKIKEYKLFKNTLHITPDLETRLKKTFSLDL